MNIVRTPRIQRIDMLPQCNWGQLDKDARSHGDRGAVRARTRGVWRHDHDLDDDDRGRGLRHRDLADERQRDRWQ